MLRPERALALAAEVDHALRHGQKDALVFRSESTPKPVVVLVREALSDAAGGGKPHPHHLAPHRAEDIAAAALNDDEHLSVRVLGSPGAKLVEEATVIDGRARHGDAGDAGTVLQESTGAHLVAWPPLDLLWAGAPLGRVFGALLRAGERVEVDHQCALDTMRG